VKHTLEIRIGIFFTLAFIAGVLVLQLVGMKSLFLKGYHLRADFNEIQELKTGDPVRLAGVQIGKVEKIQLTNGAVEVLLNVKKEAGIKTDSKASVQFTGLMGQNFVSLNFGSPSAPPAADGALLAAEEQPDLNALMVKLEGVAEGVAGMTKNFSFENLTNLLGPFTAFMKENNPRLSAIVANLQNISDRIVNGQGDVGRLINEDQLYFASLSTVSNLNLSITQLHPLFNDLKLTLEETRTLVAQVNQGRGTIGLLLRDDALYDQTTTAMMNVREILEKANQGKGAVGQLLNDPDFVHQATVSLQKVDLATEGLQDSGALSIAGEIGKRLF
jgi:phospholipid/cholesterol/gamma-HCH transport system substrate-binding protein